MTTTIRFPFNRNTATFAAETNQIITILPTTGTLLKGGEATYVSVAAWKTAEFKTEAPYTCVAIEFSADRETAIGNGVDQLVGLYGQVNLNNAGTLFTRSLIGILGVNIGNPAPRIPIVQQAAGNFVGYTHLTANIAAYDALSIGGVAGDIIVADGVGLVTVVARPIRTREYLG